MVEEITVAELLKELIDTVSDLGEIEEHTRAIEDSMETVVQTLDHPAFTTPFEDYTVTEALLLLLLFYLFMNSLFRMWKGAFSWLN